MKEKLAKLIESAAVQLKIEGFLPDIEIPIPQVSIPKERKFGDYSTNFALGLSKPSKLNPKDVAGALIEKLIAHDELIAECEIAGPGFINIFINHEGMFKVLKKIEDQGDDFGTTHIGDGIRVQVEFVSANPTGPLHIGHGRGAVFGDTLARILTAAGFKVEKEYYLNDAGVQMSILGRSTFMRYRQLLGDKVEIPEGHYVGDYLVAVAEALQKEKGDDLTESDLPAISDFAAKYILDSIKTDCEKIRVVFDNWFSEQTLHDSGTIARTLRILKDKGIAYDKDGALWFATTRYGDDKDRVLIKSDGQMTYFAADVAYHANKFYRGFDKVVNVWGADHHGYIARMKAAVQAEGRSADDLDIMLIQLVTLTRSGEVQQMSTRSGKFITLRELSEEVGADALRYFFLMRRHDAQLEFDIDLAMEQSNKNPVFYCQYMHARICSLIAKAKDQYIPIAKFDDIDLALFEVAEEKELARHLADFQEVVNAAAKNREPHRLIHYIFELANQFHYYYHHNRVITEEPKLTAARLALCVAAKQVLKNALSLAGIQAPETM